MSRTASLKSSFALALERTLWILGYLQKFGAITSPFAMQRLGISLRTFRRDIERLRAAGHRIFAEHKGDHWAIVYRGFDPDYAEIVRRRVA